MLLVRDVSNYNTSRIQFLCDYILACQNRAKDLSRHSRSLAPVMIYFYTWISEAYVIEGIIKRVI